MTSCPLHDRCADPRVSVSITVSRLAGIPSTEISRSISLHGNKFAAELVEFARANQRRLQKNFPRNSRSRPRRSDRTMFVSLPACLTGRSYSTQGPNQCLAGGGDYEPPASPAQLGRGFPGILVVVEVLARIPHGSRPRHRRLPALPAEAGCAVFARLPPHHYDPTGPYNPPLSPGKFSQMQCCSRVQSPGCRPIFPKMPGICLMVVFVL